MPRDKSRPTINTSNPPEHHHSHLQDSTTTLLQHHTRQSRRPPRPSVNSLDDNADLLHIGGLSYFCDIGHIYSLLSAAGLEYVDVSIVYRPVCPTNKAFDGSHMSAKELSDHENSTKNLSTTTELSSRSPIFYVKVQLTATTKISEQIQQFISNHHQHLFMGKLLRYSPPKTNRDYLLTINLLA